MKFQYIPVHFPVHFYSSSTLKFQNSSTIKLNGTIYKGYTVGNQEMLMFGLVLVLMVLLGVLLNSKKKTPPPPLEIPGFDAARNRFELNNQNDLLPPLP